MVMLGVSVRVRVVVKVKVKLTMNRSYLSNVCINYVIAPFELVG